MTNREIKLIITDFDGTLVDTFEANLKAYQAAFESGGLKLSEQQYKACFGYRFEKFMNFVGINDNNYGNGRHLCRQNL